jgi:hypothetical protein
VSDQQFSAVAMTQHAAHQAVMQGYAHAKALLANGEEVLISVGPALEPITIKQRKFLHGPVFGQISEQVRVNGERYTTDVWKEFFRKLFLADIWEMRKVPRWDPTLCRLVQPKRATPQRVRRSTEELGIRAYAEFTNKVIDHAVAEFSVEFVFTVEEQELRTAKPRAKAKPQQPAQVAESLEIGNPNDEPEDD